MSFPPSLRRARLGALVLALLTATACDEGTPLAPEGQPVVVTGQVLSVASSTAPAAASSPSGEGPLGGIEVTVEGSAATTLTDERGGFRLEVESVADWLVIRFRRGGLDARLELEGLPPGATFDPGTRLFSWTPAHGDQGAYPLHFVVTDDDLLAPASDAEDIVITVTQRNPGDNEPPLLDPLTDRYGLAG